MEILIKPIVTEKLTAQGEKLNRYGFIVNADANKLQIKAAIEQKYGVSVESVNTVNYNGKLKSRYTRAGVLTGYSDGSFAPASSIVRAEAAAIIARIADRSLRVKK